MMPTCGGEGSAAERSETDCRRQPEGRGGSRLKHSCPLGSSQEGCGTQVLKKRTGVSALRSYGAVSSTRQQPGQRCAMMRCIALALRSFITFNMVSDNLRLIQSDLSIR